MFTKHLTVMHLKMFLLIVDTFHYKPANLWDSQIRSGGMLSLTYAEKRDPCLTVFSYQKSSS